MHVNEASCEGWLPPALREGTVQLFQMQCPF